MRKVLDASLKQLAIDYFINALKNVFVEIVAIGLKLIAKLNIDFFHHSWRFQTKK